MKIKINPKNLDISYLGSEHTQGFFVGDLSLNNGHPPILKISHSNHKTVTEKKIVR